MKLRQAKKIMGWSKGNGHSTSKDSMKSQYRRFNQLRLPYYNITLKCIVHPSWHDIDIIRRAHTRLFRWLRNGKTNKKISF